MGKLYLTPTLAYTYGTNAYPTTWSTVEGAIFTNRDFTTSFPMKANSVNYLALQLGTSATYFDGIQTKMYNDYWAGWLSLSYSTVVTDNPATAFADITTISNVIQLTTEVNEVIKYYNLGTRQAATWIFLTVTMPGDWSTFVKEFMAYVDTENVTAFEFYDENESTILTSGTTAVALGNTYLNYPEPSPLTNDEKFVEAPVGLTKQVTGTRTKQIWIKNVTDNTMEDVTVTIMTNSSDGSSDELMSISATDSNYNTTPVNLGTVLSGANVALWIKTDGTIEGASLDDHYNNLKIQGTEVIP